MEGILQPKKKLKKKSNNIIVYIRSITNDNTAQFNVNFLFEKKKKKGSTIIYIDIND